MKQLNQESQYLGRIQIEDLPNTILESYRYTNLLGPIVYKNNYPSLFQRASLKLI
jgi:hypothetical protein